MRNRAAQLAEAIEVVGGLYYSTEPGSALEKTARALLTDLWDAYDALDD